VRFDGFELHLGRGELFRDGTPIRLRPLATRLLVLLASRPGELVALREIRDQLWGDTFVDAEQGVHNLIRQIRAALGESAKAPRLVETVARRGYRLRGQVEPGAIPRADAARPRRGRALLAAALVLTAIGALAIRASHVADRSGTAYEQARELLDKDTREAARRSIPLFERASRAMPLLAAAHSGLAAAILRAKSEDPSVERARVAATTALRLDPSDPQALSSLGEIAMFHDFDLQAARAAYDRAVAVTPHDPLILRSRALVRSAEGRHDEAIADAQLAARLDPGSLRRLDDLGYVYYVARRYAEAEAAYEALLEREPLDVHAKIGLLHSRFARGEYDRARPLAQDVLCNGESATREAARLSTATGVEIERRYLEARLACLRSAAARGAPVCPSVFALTHARLGHRREALVWLEEALRSRTPTLAFVAVHPHLDSLRPLPEYRDFERQVGIATFDHSG
jgi:DNA-binding winged helix-turn-helix (wHTH) protein/Tfp pilus assembly protein PilF